MNTHTIDLAGFALVTDGVMGGISQGTMTRALVYGREAARMHGSVSLENNGGFVQMSASLETDSSPFDASRFTGIAITATGNGETYNVHLRTSDLTRRWQSYRQSFVAGPHWQTHHIPFDDLAPHRVETPLNAAQLTRIGIVAIGRVMQADVSVAALAFYTR